MSGGEVLDGRPRWTLRDCIEHRCTPEQYVADLKLDVDERLARDHERRVARVVARGNACYMGVDRESGIDATCVQSVTMAMADRFYARGFHDLAVIARKYAVDRPRWWYRFTRRAG